MPTKKYSTRINDMKQHATFSDNRKYYISVTYANYVLT